MAKDEGLSELDGSLSTCAMLEQLRVETAANHIEVVNHMNSLAQMMVQLQQQIHFVKHATHQQVATSSDRSVVTKCSQPSSAHKQQHKDIQNAALPSSSESTLTHELPERHRPS